MILYVQPHFGAISKEGHAGGIRSHIAKLCTVGFLQDFDFWIQHNYSASEHASKPFGLNNIIKHTASSRANIITFQLTHKNRRKTSSPRATIAQLRVNKYSHWTKLLGVGAILVMWPIYAIKLSFPLPMDAAYKISLWLAKRFQRRRSLKSVYGRQTSQGQEMTLT